MLYFVSAIFNFSLALVNLSLCCLYHAPAFCFFIVIAGFILSLICFILYMNLFFNLPEEGSSNA